MMRSDDSSRSFAAGGILFSLVINGLFVAGIALAAGLQDKHSGAEAIEQSELEDIPCRYFTEERLVRATVKAVDWQAAEAEFCGSAFSGVVIPPFLLSGVRAGLSAPDSHPVVLAQRESCSCSDSDELLVMRDIGVVEAPRLGNEPKKRRLPEIINNPEQVDKNVVNTDAKTRTPRKKRKKSKDPPKFDNLLNAADTFDPARPENDRTATGETWGSKTSTSATGQGDEYLQKVKARIENTMRAPSSIPTSQLKELKARFWIKVGATGSVMDWGWRKKSGNDTFDDMVERSIKRFTLDGGSTFPQPPQVWMLKEINVKVDGSKIR